QLIVEHEVIGGSQEPQGEALQGGASRAQRVVLDHIPIRIDQLQHREHILGYYTMVESIAVGPIRSWVRLAMRGPRNALVIREEASARIVGNRAILRITAHTDKVDN